LFKRFTHFHVVDTAQFLRQNIVMPKLKNGVGATCAVLMRMLHPRKRVSERFPNAAKTDKLTGLIVQSKEVRKIAGREQECVLFRHDDFDDEILYCAVRWVVVTTESAIPFHAEPVRQEEEAAEEPRTEISGDLFQRNNRARGTAEDVSEFRSAGFDVDDDNDPAPENIPTTVPATPTPEGLQWGWNGVCQRQLAQGDELPARLVGVNLENITILKMFLTFLPRLFLEEVVLKASNAAIVGKAITVGEFYIFLGLWFYMATIKGFTKDQFWSARAPDMYDGAPVRFHGIMTRRRFDTILSSLRYTNEEKPTYKDKFCRVRQVITAWNDNMSKIFRPSWVSCLE
jgi:hypothetical protein